MNKTELEETVSRHLKKKTGQTPSDQEVADCAEGIVSFFELLKEADKKLMKADESSDNRNPDNPD